MNGFGKIRGRTDRDGRVIDFYLYLAAMFENRQHSWISTARWCRR